MSGDRVPYHLRQNKHVERQLFAELLSYVNRARPVRQYLYVSFGGVFFEDFKMMYSQFGIKDMLSLEVDEWVYLRQQKNRPYGCIQCKHMDSGSFIDQVDNLRQEFPESNNLICWLDYAAAKQTRLQLEEFQSLLPKLDRYDIVKITVNANPNALGDFKDKLAELNRDPTNTLDQKDNLLNLRHERLRERLGDMLPEGVEPTEMNQDVYPSVLLRSIQRAAANAMQENPELVFQPLGSFVYADSQHNMLTCTGILLRAEEQKRFISNTGLRKFQFSGTNWEMTKIDVPFLSPREKFILDTEMDTKTPDQVAARLGFQFDKDEQKSLSMIQEYNRFNRFYPHFHRVQY